MARWALLVGLVAAAACGVGIAVGARQSFFRAYLLAFTFWTGIAGGGLALRLLHGLAGGAWGDRIRRPLDAALATLPLTAALFLPLAFGLADLYPWARGGDAAHGLPEHRHVYLNAPFFLARTAVYFAVWIGIATVITHKRRAAAAKRWSGPGLVLYGLTTTFASIDWIMSLEGVWISTIFGLLAMVGQVLTALAVAVVFVSFVDTASHKAVTHEQRRDLGNLLLAFVMLWAYLSFSQLLIIWSGNLPEEITWYLPRLRGAWTKLAVLLLVVHFAAPFFILLFRKAKHSLAVVGAVAAGLCGARLLDVAWVIKPTFVPDRIAVGWMDVGAFATVGGLWTAMFVRHLEGSRHG